MTVGGNKCKYMAGGTSTQIFCELPEGAGTDLLVVVSQVPSAVLQYVLPHFCQSNRFIFVMHWRVTLLFS